MAGERTEAATPRRLEEMRAKGQVARSVEVNAAVGLLASFAILQQFGADIGGRLYSYTQRSLLDLGQGEFTISYVAELGKNLGFLFLGIMAPLFILLPAAGVVSNVAQVGPLLSGQALTPKFEHINPLQGFKRMFSTRSLVELIKAIVKTALVLYILQRVYTESMPQILDLASYGDLRAAIPRLGELSLRVGMMTAVAFVVVAVLDFAYQRWDFIRGSRMSIEDVREESRNIDGRPEVRAALRRRQRQLSQGRMMADVPKATLVVTNPTHFAVALFYDAERGGAPLVLAKGADLIAARIKAIAAEHSVPIVENKPLAQALYRYVEIGREIPTSLFQAVAEVLAYIYSLRGSPTEARPAPPVDVMPGQEDQRG